jgi:FlaA1/EpsC-like NDP-sugar epimerase
MLQSGNQKKLVQRVNRHAKRIAPLALADFIVLFVAYSIAFSVRLEKLVIPLGARENSGLFFMAAAAVTFICLYVFGGYHRIWLRTSGHDVIVVVNAVLVSTATIAAADYFFFPERPFPMSVALVGNPIAMTGFVAVRYRTRVLSGFSWRWRAIWHRQFPIPETRVLMVGAGDAGQSTAWRLKHRQPAGHRYTLAGFVDDDEDKQGMYVEGCPVLGKRSDIPHLTEKYKVDLIVVAIHNIAGSEFREVLGYCEQTKARIKIVPDIFAAMDETRGAPVLRDIQPEDLLGRKTVERYAAVDVAPITGRVILVTGAAGSIGSELCRQLITYDPVKLILLDNNESGLHDLVTELHTEKLASVLVPALADITNRLMVKRLFEEHRPEAVFHSAAYKHVPMLEHYPDESIRVNIGGTQQVAGLARDYGAERFVLISTDKAVNPSSIMGASKRVCELLMHAFSQQSGNQTLFTSVRFGNVLGSRGSVVPTFTRQIDAGGPVTVTHKDMTRYFMTIPEAVNLVLHAACLTRGDDLFMLRMGEVVRIVELAERMIRLRGLRPYEDIPIEFTGIRPGEKLHEELSSAAETQVPTVHPFIVELIGQRNGLQPVSFSDRTHTLFREGLDPNREPIAQLRELIELGQHEEELASLAHPSGD